jgi:hypothetical protein
MDCSRRHRPTAARLPSAAWTVEGPTSQLARWTPKLMLGLPADVRPISASPFANSTRPAPRVLIRAKCGYSAIARPRLSHMPQSMRPFSASLFSGTACRRFEGSAALGAKLRRASRVRTAALTVSSSSLTGRAAAPNSFIQMRILVAPIPDVHCPGWRWILRSYMCQSSIPARPPSDRDTNPGNCIYYRVITIRVQTHKIHQTIAATRQMAARKFRASLRLKSLILQIAFSIRCLCL